MKYGELNLGQIEAIVNKLGGIEGVKSFLSGETVVSAPAEAIANLFHLQVNYDLSVKEAIKAGDYDWKNDDINDKNFKTSRSGSVEIDIRLVHFNKNISSENVLKELNKMGLRPAELHELLALGAKYPDKQKKYPIVALGSVWRRGHGYRSVPGLWHDDSERSLNLYYFGLGWHANDRFVAVSK